MTRSLILRGMEITRKSINFGISDKFCAGKNCLIALVLIASIGTVELISSYWEFQDTSCEVSSCPSFSKLNSLDILIQDKYLPTENDDLFADAPQKFNSEVSTFNLGILTSHPPTSQYETLFDRISSSPYLSLFASLPLRSPPVFS